MSKLSVIVLGLVMIGHLALVEVNTAKSPSVGHDNSLSDQEITVRPAGSRILEMYRYKTDSSTASEPMVSNEFLVNQLEREKVVSSLCPLFRYILAMYQQNMEERLLKILRVAYMLDRLNISKDQQASLTASVKPDDSILIADQLEYREKKKVLPCINDKSGQTCRNSYMKTADYESNPYWESVNRR